MHLTLKFLGEIQPRDHSGIDEVLRKIAASAAPTRARLRSMGSFPHLRRPRVIWIGLEPDDALLTVLHSSLDEALQEIGFPRERRGFRPHLTLGRVRSSRGIASLVEVVESYAEVDLGYLRIDELTLFESKLTRQGAIYTALGSHRLEG